MLYIKTATITLSTMTTKHALAVYLSVFGHEFMSLCLIHQVSPVQRGTKGRCTSWPSEGSRVMNSGAWSSSVPSDRWWRWKTRGWTQSTSRSTSSSRCPDAQTSSNSSCTTSGETQWLNIFDFLLLLPAVNSKATQTMWYKQKQSKLFKTVLCVARN